MAVPLLQQTHLSSVSLSMTRSATQAPVSPELGQHGVADPRNVRDLGRPGAQLASFK